MMSTLILSTMIIVSSAIKIDELPNDRLPFRWTEAPSSLNDYPMIKDCSLVDRSVRGPCRIINPWNYLDRLGLYKIMVIQTIPLMPFTVNNNATHILFGLPSQFSWQYQSNRLFSNGTLTVSTDSWWGAANYYLSVLPFLGAVNAGLIQQEPFVLVQKENFCSKIAQCVQQTPTAMVRWTRFFSTISQPNYCSNSQIDDRIIDRCYLGPMWSAHIASIDEALPLISKKLNLLPSFSEQRFAFGWANLVDFISRSRMNTNLIKTNEYQDKFLPRRLLTDEDHPPHCPDLSYTVNKAVELILSIHADWYSDLDKIWQKPTCNFEARQEAQKVLEVVALSKIEATYYYSRAEYYGNHFPCDQ